jgi:uncharacterized protein (TIGR02118 family)
MTVAKYVALLDADRDVDADASAVAAEQIAGAAEHAAQNLVGLTVGRILEPMTGPASTVAVIQAWIEGGTDSDATAILASLTSEVAGTVSSWKTEEIVFLSPRDRVESEGPHSRINIFGTANKREDFSADAFFEYWRTTHAPISAAVPGSSGYVVSRVQRAIDTPIPRDADGFVELWWPSHDLFVAAGESDLQAVAWADVANYARTDGQFWLVNEAVVITPPDGDPGLLDGDAE